MAARDFRDAEFERMGFDNLYFHKNGDMPSWIEAHYLFLRLNLSWLNFADFPGSDLQQSHSVNDHAISENHFSGKLNSS
jgi:hypothetical protein